jgi:radical SAM superfamily enzyme YgiQ (UPF0313 family)
MTVDILIFTGMGSSVWQRTIGAYRIATELRKHNYTVQVIDQLPYMIKDNHDIFNEIINKFVGPNTLWVGFSSTFFINRRPENQNSKTWGSRNKNYVTTLKNTGLPTNDEYLDDIKQTILNKNPKCKLVLGGSKASFREGKIIDIYVEGYADSSVIEMTKWLQGKNPFFQVSYNDDDKSLSIINDRKAANFDFANSSTVWHESDHLFPAESLPMEISRGCIFSCKFCAYPLNGKKKLDYIRDTKLLKDEFVRNYELYGTTNYIFNDDTYNDSEIKLEILHDEVFSKLNFNMKFMCYLRLDLIAAKPHTAQLLLDSGLMGGFFGIESLNYQTAKSIGKGLPVNRAIETLHFLKETWQDKVITCGSFIMGLPHDTEETMTKWATLLESSDFPLDVVGINALRLYKNGGKYAWKSNFDLNAAKYGYIFPDEENEEYWENTTTGLNFNQVAELADDYSIRASKNRKAVHAFFHIPGLIAMGYTFDQMIDKSDIYIKDVESKYKQMNQIYFNKLLGKE